MTAELTALSFSALLVGFSHTLAGPDHYVPFVAMSRVGQWSLRKTIAITILCGFGHVGSSVLLGFIGIALGIVVFQLEMIEAMRGDLAGWLLTAFGLVYFLWGVACGVRNRPHQHVHLGADGSLVQHTHELGVQHSAIAAQETTESAQDTVTAMPAEGTTVVKMTPWILFTIFIFGPCESLIPMLMYPAAKGNLAAVAFVTFLFGLATLVTMTGIVVLMYLGSDLLHPQRKRFAWAERYSHALAGAIVLACGLAVKFGL